MANNIDWGQGAKNNDIGWGQGSVNNDISWGSIYADSYSGETDIIGITPSESLANAFESRVLADSGTFEAKSCLITQIESLL